METLNNTAVMLASALALHRKSLRLVPLNGKVALVKNWPGLRLSEQDIADWTACGVNWGIITGEPLVVIDTDSDEAEAWVHANHIQNTVMVSTGGGGRHRYFRCPEGPVIRSKSAALGIHGLDVKGWHSYIVAAGSIHPQTYRQYEYLPGRELRELQELPVFNPEWIRHIRNEPITKPTLTDQGTRPSSRVYDVRAYIRRIPSIEGQGGDKACFTVACLLVEEGCTFDEAIAEMEAWNEQCAIPYWSRAALERKIRSAFLRVRGLGTQSGE